MDHGHLKSGKLYKIVNNFSVKKIIILFLQRENFDYPILGMEEGFVFLYPNGKIRKQNKRFVHYFVEKISSC